MKSLYLISLLPLFFLILYGCGNSGGSPTSSTANNSCTTALSLSKTANLSYQARRYNNKSYKDIFTRLLGYTKFVEAWKSLAFGQTGKSVTGSIQYEDKAYDNNGFTGSTTFKPVRFATIEAVRNSDSTVLSSTTTDSTGTYSMLFTNDGTAGVYIRAVSQTDSVTVKNNTNGKAIYAIKSSTIDDSAGQNFTLNMNITVSSGAGGAFNILDVLINGMIFISGLSGTTPPMLTTYWENNSCDGTYFQGSDSSIHLLGGCSGDTDEYDDDIILHEFGHFVASSFSRDDSPGGSHTLGDNTEDIRLAWSEGWAHFLSSAIRGVSSQTDTVLSTASSFEIEGPSPLASSTIYTTSEVSVATVLWDIFDSANESFDGLSLNITPIWDVLNGYLPSAASISIEDFWDGWFARDHDSQTELINISADRKMELFSDGFEPDDTANSARKIAVGTTEHHTLYPSGDKDLMAFDVTQGQSYTIETTNLSNGADTYLEILSSDGKIVTQSNDNRNGQTYPLNSLIFPVNDASTLSSCVQTTPSSTGTLYARISRSPSAPNSAGVYGSYDLRITSP